ncbi:unnamed protein product [Prunus armeniaca]|uniref:Secreted protein n=1 Tax=Prunus armeniaca TaxID=36596 RepID=A0A6J5XUE0_PRUAR|nr:unnamed protein product [Prunus armeniaca]
MFAKLAWVWVWVALDFSMDRLSWWGVVARRACWCGPAGLEEVGAPALGGCLVAVHARGPCGAGVGARNEAARRGRRSVTGRTHGGGGGSAARCGTGCGGVLSRAAGARRQGGAAARVGGGGHGQAGGL